MSKVALVAGASGLVGKQLVKVLLDRPDYSEVKVLVRRKLGINNSRLHEIFYDFTMPEDMPLKADILFCCLGTTIREAGSKDAFRRVDEHFVVQTARLGLLSGASQFHVITAMGADKRSFFFYNRVKGEVEEQLKALGYPALHIYRPSLLLGQRDQKRAGEKAGEFIMNIFDPLMLGPLKKYKAVSATKVARAMEAFAHSSGIGTFIHESDELQMY